MAIVFISFAKDHLTIQMMYIIVLKYCITESFTRE